MIIKVSQTNKVSGSRRCWRFYFKPDHTSFDIKQANNQLVFSGYTEQDAKGKILRAWDTCDNSLNKNCKWEQAKPSDKIQAKALEKFKDSLSLVVRKEN